MNKLQEYFSSLFSGLDFDIFLTSVGGITGVVVIVLLLVAIVAIALSLRRKPKTSPAKKTWTLSPWKAARHFGQRLLETGRYLFTSREWRYRSPWYLMLGGQDSGTRSLGHYLELIQRNNLDHLEKALGAAGTEWFFLNEGVIINLLHEDEQSPAAGTAWIESLREIKQLRSERAVDGIVLAIPVDILKKGSAKELQTLADELFLKLHTIQETFEFVLPVYLIITKCEQLKGFQAFWSVQEAASHAQMFGWSSPYRTDHNFSLEWIDEAFDYIFERLKEIQLSSIALEHKALKDDNYYLFPSILAPVKTRLKDVIGNIFKSTKYQSNLLFRGIYFTGELLVDENASQLPRSDEAALDIDGDGDYDFEEIAFVKDLFEQKIFREANLAKPSGKGIFSRDIYIRRLQFALCLFCIFLFGALAYKNTQLDRQLVAITEVVHMTTSLDIAGLDDCSAPLSAASTYQLLSNLAQVDDNLSTVFIPTSFRNDLPTRIAATLSNEGFEEIIFPNLRCFMKLEATKLVSVDDDPEHDSDEQLSAYLDKVIEFEKNRARFEAIAPHSSSLVSSSVRPDSQDCRAGEIRINLSSNAPVCETHMEAFIALDEYVFRERTPPILREKPFGQHLKALLASNYDLYWDDTLDSTAPGLVIPDICRVDDNASVGNDTGFGRPLSYRLILTNICVIAVDHLNNIESNSLLDKYQIAGMPLEDDFVGAIDRDPEQTLNAINHWLDYINTEWLLPGPKNDPCGQISRTLTDYFAQLVADYGYPKEILDRITANFGDENCSDHFLNGVSDQNIPPLGQLVETTETDGSRHYRFSPTYDSVIPALARLQSASWMTLPDQENFSCAAYTDTWESSYLTQIISLYQEYENFARDNNLALTQDRNNIASTIAHVKFNRVVNYLLTRAQLSGSGQFYTSASYIYRPVSDLESTISDKTRKFDLAKNDLLQILSILRKLDMNGTFTGLSQCSRRYTLSVLDSIGNLVLDSQLYRKVPKAFSAASAFSNYLFQIGSEGDLKEYLQDQHKRLALIAQYADPLVTFLLNTESVHGENAKSEVLNFNYWNNTLREFNKFSQGIDQNNQVQKLDDYLTYMLGDVDVNKCTQSDLTPPGSNDLGNDLFSSKRLDIQMRVIASCNQALSLGFESRYSQMSSWFNANLAGKYPFQQQGAAVVSEASPQDLREFFNSYGNTMDVMAETAFLLGKSDEQWKQIDTFLMQMATLRNFFASNLNATGAGKALMLQFDFPRFQNYNSDTNAWPELAGGSMRTGNAANNLFSENQPLPWSFGDSLGMDLNWARNSQFLPLRVETSRFVQDPANPLHLNFQANGNWALLKLLDSFHSTDSALASLGEVGTTVLEFPITLRHVDDQALSPAVTVKTLIVPLTILAQDPQTQIWQPTALPAAFPVSAPPLKAAPRVTSNP